MAGELVGMPTETVYGLAAIVDNPVAISNVYAVKQRPLFDPLIAHVARGEARLGSPFERALELVDISGFQSASIDLLTLLASRFWPGPLTMVLPRAPGVNDLVTAGLTTIAVRMPAHPTAERLIDATGRPLVAPSANRFGRISPTSAQAVIDEIGDRIEYVLDGGVCSIGVESTVIAVEADGTVRLLRPGGVPTEEIAHVVGRIGPRGARIEAPGQTPSHYAPRAPILLVDGPLAALQLDPRGTIALLVARGPLPPVVEALSSAGHQVVAARVLSSEGDEREAARNLFAALRDLDAAAPDWIIAEAWPSPTGLGAAIRDRLARASAPR